MSERRFMAEFITPESFARFQSEQMYRDIGDLVWDMIYDIYEQHGPFEGPEDAACYARNHDVHGEGAVLHQERGDKWATWSTYTITAAIDYE